MSSDFSLNRNIIDNRKFRKPFPELIFPSHLKCGGNQIMRRDQHMSSNVHPNFQDKKIKNEVSFLKKNQNAPRPSEHPPDGETYQVRTFWNWNSGNNRVRCSPDWSVYRCIERYCMTPRQREDDNNLSVGHRNHLKLGIEPESWLQSHELGF